MLNLLNTRREREILFELLESDEKNIPTQAFHDHDISDTLGTTARLSLSTD